MGGGAKAPKPSKEERALQAQQAELLKLQQSIIEQQRAQQAILLPFFAEQQGFDVETDANGNITKISKRPDEVADLNKTLEKELAERSLKALRGELPVSPGLERDIGRQEETLRDRLAAQLGPGYETSSAGIEALQNQAESAEVLREGARTAQLTLAEQLGISRQQQNDYKKLTGMDYLRQVSTGDSLTMAGAFGQVAGGVGQAIQPYAQQRQMQMNASIANSQSRAGIIGAGIGLVGSLFSDERLKSDSVIVGRIKPLGIPIRVYTMGGVRRIGVFASDVEIVKPHAVGERMGYKTVNYEAL